MSNSLQEPISFTAFLRTLLLNPHTFFRQYLAPEAPRPYWWFVVSLYFSGSLIAGLLDFRTSADLEGIRMTNDSYLMLLVSAPLGGVLGYFLAGWFMKLLILIYGGKASVEQSRSIAFYTAAAYNMYFLLLFLISWLCAWWSFFVISQIVGVVLFSPYLIYVHYCAVMAVPGTKKGRIIFFWIFLMLLVCFLGTLVALSNPRWTLSIFKQHSPLLEAASKPSPY